MTVAIGPHHTGTPTGDDLRRRAWIWLALIPVFFVAGFALGEVMYAILGYKPENDDAPLWVDLIASVAALVVALVPCVGAVIHGHRASTAGVHGARVPMAIGAVVGVALVVMTVLST